MTHRDDPWTAVDNIMDMDDGIELDAPVFRDYDPCLLDREELEDAVELDVIEEETAEQVERAMIRALWIGAAVELAELLADHLGASPALRVAARAVATDEGAEGWSTGYAEGMCRVLETALAAADRRVR